jgi:hypothetical protein
MANTCNWTEDPFKKDEIPCDETRELDQKPLPTQEINAAYWRRLHYETAQRIAKMDLLRLRICPNIPPYNGSRGYTKAKTTYFKVARAEDILQRAFNGMISYSAAHREWNFYLRKCEHGTNIYSPEHECFSCNIAEDNLNAIYENGWTHIEKTV